MVYLKSATNSVFLLEVCGFSCATHTPRKEKRGKIFTVLHDLVPELKMSHPLSHQSMICTNSLSQIRSQIFRMKSPIKSVSIVVLGCALPTWCHGPLVLGLESSPQNWSSRFAVVGEQGECLIRFENNTVCKEYPLKTIERRFYLNNSI